MDRRFTAIAETGSISAAARRLALSKSVVSERLTDLERGVGARLVHRTTRLRVFTALYARAKRFSGCGGLQKSA